MVVDALDVFSKEVGKYYTLTELQCGQLEACWKYCRDLRNTLGLEYPRLLNDLNSLDRNNIPLEIGDVILFNVTGVWHSGLCGPDCLHFLHIVPVSESQFQARQERLTRLPWNLAIYGAYR